MKPVPPRISRRNGLAAFCEMLRFESTGVWAAARRPTAPIAKPEAVRNLRREVIAPLARLGLGIWSGLMNPSVGQNIPPLPPGRRRSGWIASAEPPAPSLDACSLSTLEGLSRPLLLGGEIMEYLRCGSVGQGAVHAQQAGKVGGHHVLLQVRILDRAQDAKEGGHQA